MGRLKERVMVGLVCRFCYRVGRSFTQAFVRDRPCISNWACLIFGRVHSNIMFRIPSGFRFKANDQKVDHASAWEPHNLGAFF